MTLARRAPTVYVSRACEWKSNLFVPKTNDILFAQSSHSQQLLQPQHAANNNNHQQQESSVSYFDGTTFSTQAGANNYINSGQPAAPPVPPSASLPDNPNGGRTVLLSTDSKALVLALPQLQPSQTFAGYEPGESSTTKAATFTPIHIDKSSDEIFGLTLTRPPPIRPRPLGPDPTRRNATNARAACSIRLIVPRNMRILAKLNSRKLTFAQEQQFDSFDQPPPPSPPSGLFGGFPFDETTATIVQQQQQQPQKSLWVSLLAPSCGEPRQVRKRAQVGRIKFN